jgi:uncharacterized protein YcfJ
MPVDHGRLLEVVSSIARSRNVTVTVKQSAKAGVIAGGSCFFGAVIGGPVGLVLGKNSCKYLYKFISISRII